MTNPISSALGWIEGALLGTVATAVAVLAIASLGFLMLSGRKDLRRSARVVLGCFIIFGASTIAAGIHAVILGTPDPSADHAQIAPAPPPEFPTQPQQTAPSAYDPYAGAGLPPPR